MGGVSRLFCGSTVSKPQHSHPQGTIGRVGKASGSRASAPDGVPTIQRIMH
jgi:hypothetical protein